MERISKAIAAGRCALAVSGTLFRDEKVVLALSDRASLRPMILSGDPVPPATAIHDAGLARAIGQPNGYLLLIEPQSADAAGVQQLAARLKSAPHKPTVVFVARKLDFMTQAAFAGLKTEQVKERGPTFLANLPTPPPESEAPVPDVPKPTAAKAAAGLAAPGPLCVGREDELAQLGEMLASGGPIVVDGPVGSGRRTVVEHAIAHTDLLRQPTLHLARDTGFDALAGRLNTLLAANGHTEARGAWARHVPPPQLIEALLTDLTHAEALANHVLEVRHGEVAWGEDGLFFRKSRLEMLVEALTTRTYPLRVVFVATSQPVFYREGRDAPLRRMTLGALRGRDYHPLFEAHHAPSFPKERYGPLSERLHGHPLAVRLAAVGMRHQPELVDDDKAFRLKDFHDAQGLRKLVDKRIKALSAPVHRALCTAAHLRGAATGHLLADLGINKKTRDALLLDGLLAVVGGDGQPRRYYVPEPIVTALGHKETAHFDTMHRLAARLREHAGEETSEGVAFALRQVVNRLLDQSRRDRDTSDIGLADADSVLDNIAGMLLSQKNPRPDIAAKILASVLKRDPSNSDAWLLELERLRRIDAPHKERRAALDEALRSAPVPELFHDAVGFFQSKGQSLEAIAALEQGVSLLADHSRLRCRLASLLYRQGRRHDAIRHLEQAMADDPMLPDAYGLLGTIRTEEGVLSIDKAEDLLREAVRLAPQDIVQTSRLIRLLLDIAEGVPARQEAARAEIHTLLDGLREVHKQSWEVHLLYAEALRAESADLERAAWFLKEARKLAPKRRNLTRRFKLEQARLDIALGKVDDAERALKKASREDPSDPEFVQLIAEIHAARGHLVAAHAELSRALDRMSPHALDRQRAEARRDALAQAIQAAHGLAHSTDAPPSTEQAVEATDDNAKLDNGETVAKPAGQADPAKEDPPSEAPGALEE